MGNYILERKPNNKMLKSEMGKFVLKAGRAEGMEDHELTPHIETLYNQSVRTIDRMKKLPDGKWDAFGIPYGLKEKLVEMLEDEKVSKVKKAKKAYSDSEDEEFKEFDHPFFKDSSKGSTKRYIKGNNVEKQWVNGDNFVGDKTEHHYGGVGTINN